MNSNSDLSMCVAFISGVVFCIACGAIADRKGASVVVWALLGLLAGPLGLIGVLCVPSTSAAKERQALKGGKMMRCPKCAELIRSEATVCKHCRSEIAPAATLPAWHQTGQ